MCNGLLFDAGALRDFKEETLLHFFRNLLARERKQPSLRRKRTKKTRKIGVDVSAGGGIFEVVEAWPSRLLSMARAKHHVC